MAWSWSVPWGVFAIGFVFGYLLLYAVRHTKEFSIEMLSTAIGAVGGATVIAWLGKFDNWIGPYGIGLAAGFVVYFVLSLILGGLEAYDEANHKIRYFLSTTLLGAPKE